jgi:SAM-dependent methyltransferase
MLRRVWAEATYLRLAALLEPVERELVEKLAPAAGEDWLDLTTGGGAVAILAAHAGAQVTAIDGAEPIVEQARLAAEEAGVEIQFDVGAVEYLPYDDATFDGLVSNFGVILASDHANVASELGRVARPGARLGFTAWKPNPKLAELYRRFTDEPIEGREAYEWGREDHVEDMLGEEFELDYADGTIWVDVTSGEALWDVFSTSAPPVMSLLDRLDDEKADEFHRGFVELYEEYREGDVIRWPRRYLLVLGKRR